MAVERDNAPEEGEMKINYTKRGSSAEMTKEVKETILWIFVINGKPISLC
jgi:hypothetical protein